MAIVRKTLAEVLAEPFRFTPEQRARLDVMTDEEIGRNAESDPDNPPWTDEQLERAVAARTVRLARQRTGLSQAAFAETFQINAARLKDWEQGRHKPDSAALAYIRVIAHDPEMVRRVLARSDAA